MMGKNIKTIALSVIMVFFFTSSSSLILFAAKEFSAEKAKKVDLTLKRIAKKRKKPCL